MCSKKSILVRSSCVVFMAMFLCCFGPNIACSKSENMYYPKLPQRINTIDEAKKDLSALLSNYSIITGATCMKYHGQRGINNINERNALRKFMDNTFWHSVYDSKGELLFMDHSGKVLEDRIQMSPHIAFYYSDLPDNVVVIEKTQEWPAVTMHMGYLDGKPAEGTQRLTEKDMKDFTRQYKIHFPNLISFLFKNLDDAQRFADDLFFIQQSLKKEHDKRRALFQSQAARYRTLKVKPPVPEEQRRLIVQANLLSQQKDYNGAIDLYNKVLDVNPVTYPAAYSNMALLCAQTGRFRSAISFMEQYLFLAPDAPDARKAQDAIYEWEIMMEKKK